MPKLTEYLDTGGRSPFGRWFDGLDAQAAAKVSAVLYRLEQGNQSEIKALGGGIYERRIHWGPGLRIYFGREGPHLILLLGGGTKSGQRRDIETARKAWKDYQQRNEA
ncbi:MAG: type II toxin-antitoxin system RelE/ParE family toxin [Gammaproteobacteria bacterium]|nr:type II toxin-antitoxin system RelE/ParE family toxin [Gammaproteobacteria bacterium]